MKTIECLVLVGVVSGLAVASLARHDEAPADPSEWYRATAELFEVSTVPGEDGATLILPAIGARDVYAMSLAIVALGRDAESVVDATAVRQRFQLALQDGALEQSVAGPIFLGREIVRANRHLPILDEDQLVLLREVIDRALAGSDGATPSAFDGLYLQELSRALEHRASETREWLARTGAAMVPCSFESTFDLGALAGMGLGDAPCAREDLDATWASIVEHLVDAGASGIGLGECEAILALTRIWAAWLSEDRARKSFLDRQLETGMRKLGAGETGDAIACTAAMRSVAEILGAEFELHDSLARYVAAVVTGGAEPVATTLDAGGVAQLIRLQRLLGTRTTTPPRARLSPTDRLDLIEASDHAWTRADAQLADTVAAGSPGSREKAVLLRALARGENAACSATSALERAKMVADEAVNGRPKGLSLAAAASAISVLERCGEVVPSPARATVLDTSRSLLLRAENRDRAESRPDLLETWEAAAALCALAPREVPPAGSLWRLYAAEAAEVGGARHETGFVSLERTYALAYLGAISPKVCFEKGQGI